MENVIYLFFAIAAPIAAVIVFVHAMEWMAERRERREKKEEDLTVELHNKAIREEYEERKKRSEEWQKKIDRINKD